jgi:putative phosphoribosyl transferase
MVCADRAGEAVRAPRQVRVGPLGLPGELSVGSGSLGLVVFAHGSGSSRLSPRNRLVATALHESALGTLLFDLLSEAEAADRNQVFDIALLASRLCEALDWIDGQDELARLRVGLFGASTGAAAALTAAAMRPERVGAVVSRGGRPDLAAEHLARVQAPTLLIVGGEDIEVLRMNQGALRGLRCEKALQVVPGATHLFEEPGTLATVAKLAAHWFAVHLPRAQRP